MVVKENEKANVLIKMVKRGMVITLKGIKFDLNKATLKPESYPILDDAAAILTNHPEISVEIQGHTCSLGSDAYNLKLSDMRANSVRNYLIMKHMIEPYRLIARGCGETQPIASNKTEAGRMQNRRVDFLILEE
ncbi:Peptidoglycan-associated lipoprotein [subsurface metagenome]